MSTLSWNLSHFFLCKTGGRKAKEVWFCFRNCSHGSYSYFSFPLGYRKFSYFSAVLWSTLNSYYCHYLWIQILSLKLHFLIHFNFRKWIMKRLISFISQKSILVFMMHFGSFSFSYLQDSFLWQWRSCSKNTKQLR